MDWRLVDIDGVGVGIHRMGGGRPVDCRHFRFASIFPSSITPSNLNGPTLDTWDVPFAKDGDCANIVEHVVLSNNSLTSPNVR